MMKILLLKKLFFKLIDHKKDFKQISKIIGTIAGETVKHFTNYAKIPYEDLDYNLGILSYIGDPPKDGQFAYYRETAGFKLRVRCRGKVTSYQWPKSQYP